MSEFKINIMDFVSKIEITEMIENSVENEVSSFIRSTINDSSYKGKINDIFSERLEKEIALILAKPIITYNYYGDKEKSKKTLSEMCESLVEDFFSKDHKDSYGRSSGMPWITKLIKDKLIETMNSKASDIIEKTIELTKSKLTKDIISSLSLNVSEMVSKIISGIIEDKKE